MSYAAERVMQVPVYANGKEIDWVALQTWLEASACQFVNRAHFTKEKKMKGALTDEELDVLLADLPAWDDVEHPHLAEPTREEYSYAMRKRAHHSIKGIEKWL